MIILQDMIIDIQIDRKVVVLDFTPKSPHMYVIQTKLFTFFRISISRPVFSHLQNEKRS